MPEEKRKAVEQCIIAGLPGRMVEAYTLPQFQARLASHSPQASAHVARVLRSPHWEPPPSTSAQAQSYATL